MATTNIVVTIDPALLAELDQLVAQGIFTSRNQAVEVALQEMLARWHYHRLAQECAKLDPQVERAFAEEGMESELSAWPEY